MIYVFARVDYCGPQQPTLHEVYLICLYNCFTATTQQNALHIRSVSFFPKYKKKKITINREWLEIFLSKKLSYLMWAVTTFKWEFCLQLFMFWSQIFQLNNNQTVDIFFHIITMWCTHTKGENRLLSLINRIAAVNTLSCGHDQVYIEGKSNNPTDDYLHPLHCNKLQFVTLFNTLLSAVQSSMFSIIYLEKCCATIQVENLLIQWIMDKIQLILNQAKNQLIQKMPQ